MLNINTATAEAINLLPGLQGHGFEIVRYREDRDKFTELRQLEEVPGLAQAVDEGLRAQLEL